MFKVCMEGDEQGDNMNQLKKEEEYCDPKLSLKMHSRAVLASEEEQLEEERVQAEEEDTKGVEEREKEGYKTDEQTITQMNLQTDKIKIQSFKNTSYHITTYILRLTTLICSQLTESVQMK